MTTFDERERAYEKKFAMDQEKQFKAAARRNKLLGEWAAARLGLSGAAVADYVNAVVKADLAHTGHGAYDKVRKDFDEKALGVSERELRKAMADFLRIAVRQLEEAEAGKSAGRG
jgi:hypothetical protein